METLIIRGSGGRKMPTARTAGFTLIELVAVLAVIVVLMTMAVGAYLGWGRGAGIRSSAQNVKSGLALARQWALSRGSTVVFAWTNEGVPPRGCYLISSAHEGMVGNTNYLSEGVLFDEESSNCVEFKPDGTCGSSATNWPDDIGRIVIWESSRTDRGIAATIAVHRVSGYATVEE